jgi:hypothetical protein
MLLSWQVLSRQQHCVVVWTNVVVWTSFVVSAIVVQTVVVWTTIAQTTTLVQTTTPMLLSGQHLSRQQHELYRQQKQLSSSCCLDEKHYCSGSQYCSFNAESEHSVLRISFRITWYANKSEGTYGLTWRINLQYSL